NRIKELVSAQSVQEGSQKRVPDPPSLRTTFSNDRRLILIYFVASRSQRLTDTHLSRAPIPNSEETTDTRCMEP
ncbi:uncharacterized protein A1O9_04919, partial [Exophiala aquamarina CBS 119918]